MKAEKLGAMATNALTQMLAATVKPGLIDRYTCGAQKNIDFFTALRGIGSLSPWFVEIARVGIESVNLSPISLFMNIRKIGVKAETDMLKSTNGISTFKGGFFFVSLCVAAAGRILSGMMYPDSNSVCVVVAEMVQDICQREYETLDVKMKLIGSDSLTAGEKMYQKYGAPGARGEAQSGLKTVRKYALPVMRKFIKEKSLSRNDVYVQTFMTIMANTLDTGIMTKENILTAEEIQDRAGGILERGGTTTPLGREKIEKLDQHLKERGIAPGGSGALLATAIFLLSLEEEVNNKIFRTSDIKNIKSDS